MFQIDPQTTANQTMHVSRRVELIEVVSRSRRPRDRYRSPTRNMQYALMFTLVISMSLAFGCNTSERSVPAYDLVEGPPSNWTMSPDDAVLAATEYCVRDGIDLSIHSTPRISCDSLDGDRFWCILYDGFTRIPGDHFMLLINDETGDVEYVAGE